MPFVFISYRRSNSDHAQRIYRRLAAELGDDEVFLDVESIGRGRRWSDEIKEAVLDSKVLVAVIGRRWIRSRSSDYVRREIGFALRNGIPVLPVLVDRVRLPTRTRLPAGIRRVIDYQAVTLPAWGTRGYRRELESIVEELKNLAEVSATLIVRRSSAFRRWWSNVIVFIDGELRAAVGDGESTSLQVSPGRHRIQVEAGVILETRSDVHTFDAAAGDRITFSCEVEDGVKINPPVVLQRV